MCKLGNCMFSGNNPDPSKYCEKMQDTFPYQPINSYSNIFFILVGFWILKNPKAKISKLNTHVYAYLLIAMGIASFIFHAFPPNAFGFLDMYLIFALIIFLALYNFQKFLSTQQFWTIFLLLNFMTLFITNRSFDLQVLTLFVFIFICSSFLLSKNYEGLYLPLLIFSFFGLTWYLTKTDGPLCDPESVFQGHAIWHIGMAIVFGMIYYKFL